MKPLIRRSQTSRTTTCRFNRRFISGPRSLHSLLVRGVVYVTYRHSRNREVKDAKAAKALDHAAALLAALLPLIICGYVLYHMQRGNTDEAIAEVLVGEIVSEHPAMLPRDDEPRLALTANRVGQTERPGWAKERKWMRIVLGTCSSNSDFNGGCDFGLVELTPEYAELILKRMQALAELAKSDQSLHEAHYWDSSASYFQTTLDEGLDEDLEPAYDTYVVLKENVEVPDKAFKRVEYTHMVISVMGEELEVSWRASPKNASLYIETNELPKSLIEEAARGGNVVCP